MEKFGSFEVVNIGAEAAEEARQELLAQQKIWRETFRGMPAEPLIKGFEIMSNLAEERHNDSKSKDLKIAA